MKTKKILFLISLISAIILNSSFIKKEELKKPSESGITFNSLSFQEALKLAKKEKKNIFLDAYASWCGPCKILKKNVFSQQPVGEFFNKNFINLAIDMEEGEGPQLARKYRVQAYPTLLFINENGEVVGSAVGYHNETELISVAKQYVK
jgi:thioredoxin 1